MPEATAVAVRDGMIVETGTLETMQPWLEVYSYRIDERFSNHVIMPGFIDPHLHPSLAAVLLPCDWCRARPGRRPSEHPARIPRATAFNEWVQLDELTFKESDFQVEWSELQRLSAQWM